MKWIRHMTTTWDDEKIASLIGEGGKDGLALYGAWWRVLEIVASQMGPKAAEGAVKYSVSRWSVLMSLRGSHVRHYLGQLAEKELVTVEWIESDIRVTIPNLLKYRDEYSKKSGVALDNIPPREDKEEEEDKEKKKSSKSSRRKNSAVDPRRKDFIDDLKKHWDRINPEIKFAFDARDGKCVDEFLAKWPAINANDWRECMRHRKASEGFVPTQRIAQWVAKLMDWRTGPLDRYGKLLSSTKPTSPLDGVKYANVPESGQ